MTIAQSNDLLKRLEHTDTTAALAAEIELGLLWAMSQVTKIDLHPKLNSKRQPEAFSQSLFRSSSAYIEVSAISDDSFSDRDKMERAANIIIQFSDSLRKNTGKNLYFRFAEQSGYKDGQYFRKRLITSEFLLTPELKELLRSWIKNPKWPEPKLIRLTDEQIDVVIEWKNYVHPEGRTFSTMPPIAYHIEDNPIFKRLEKKQTQLSGAPKDSLRCIFLGDAGCGTLRDLRPLNSGFGAISGEQIIWHFLKRSSVDVVVVFSPGRQHNYPIQSPRIWKVTIFDKRTERPSGEHDLIEALAKQLPAPNYEGYQARSLHRQGSFAPQARGQYLASQISTRGILMPTSIKLSARLVLEYLAGRVTSEQFRDFGGCADIFESMLKAGNTIHKTRIEDAGVDEDDDSIVFELAPDYAALPLTRAENRKKPG